MLCASEIDEIRDVTEVLSLSLDRTTAICGEGDRLRVTVGGGELGNEVCTAVGGAVLPCSAFSSANMILRLRVWEGVRCNGNWFSRFARRSASLY